MTSSARWFSLIVAVAGAAAAGWFARGLADRAATGGGGASPAAAPVASAPSAPAPAADPDDPAARAAAARRGLEWLASVQQADGSWTLHKWNPRHGASGIPGFTEEDHWLDPAATGLALLAFLDAAAVDPARAADPAVALGLAWLAARQRPDGRVGYDEREVDRWFVDNLGLRSAYLAGPAPTYKARTIHAFNHAVATAALARAWRLRPSEGLRESVRRAIGFLVADEHPDYAWTDFYDPGSDIGVVPYVVLAAKALEGSDLAADAKPLLAPLPDFLERVTDPATGRTRMLTDPPQCFDGDDSTAINAFCRRLAGQDPASAPLSASLASLAALVPAWKPAAAPPGHGHARAAPPSATGGAHGSSAPSTHGAPEPSTHAAPEVSTHGGGGGAPVPSEAAPPRGAGDLPLDQALGAVVNHDLWFHGLVALQGAPGEGAPRFRAEVRRLLLAHQARAGDLAGSWDPIGVWDRVGGRIYSTAMAVRALSAP